MATTCHAPLQRLPLSIARMGKVHNPAFPRFRGQRGGLVKGFGKDAAEGWLDLAKLVSSSGGPKSAFEDLANDIGMKIAVNLNWSAAGAGRDVYMDMNGWHLYLRDISAGKGLKLNQALAQQLGMEAKSLQRQAQLEELLKKVPVSLGGGKMQVSLYDVLPSAGIRDLQRIVEDFVRNG